ncbi:MAG: hypothetical protein SPG13_06770 [Peptostreptococcus porci]|uniref:hypothetical protein n=1 Tax=Peptostreptococcus porci TaxID=2652282 RepID=UPI0023F5431C|nr:hypothetical protein [Peptostreptococcus porci]MDD7182668.1 hypothetical protein [Peptostreptococcus porci]MDY2794843.1 hypothetical protein [Peptostreptococcus porci]MDY4128474.1 hypothetical protein [Peptostreptococcus porci]MDY5480150.1 hypothetical protein [Peptostreptococcus porci]
MKKKVSDAQIRASRSWEQKNKEKTKIDTYRRTARLFINNHASLEDLEMLKKLIEEKENIL